MERVMAIALNCFSQLAGISGNPLYDQLRMEKMPVQASEDSYHEVTDLLIRLDTEDQKDRQSISILGMGMAIKGSKVAQSRFARPSEL
jgi:hypothetical protein